MKKLICFTASLFMLSSISVTTFASQPDIYVSESSVSLPENQNEFETTLNISPDYDYAGIEIAVECPDNICLTSSSNSLGSMSAAPTFANGAYWTSFFESDNILSGTMNITLNFSCAEDFEQGNISISQVKIYTKDGAAVNTEKFTPSLSISVSRENADTDPITADSQSDASSFIDSSSDTESDSLDLSDRGNTCSSLLNSNSSSMLKNSDTGKSSETNARNNNINSTNPKTGNSIFSFVGLTVVGILLGATVLINKKSK